MDPQKIFKVSEFNELIKLYLTRVGQITVEGEISKISVSQGKWIFATIKDTDASVEIFSMKFKIHNLHLLEEGMLVHVIGTPSLYEKTGRFSISADEINPAGEGALKVAFEKLKQKLTKEGLFNEDRKRELPQFPEKIGLITAKDSRAYSDFIKVISARIRGLKIYFYPVIVQGKNSAVSIVNAFNYFNEQKNVDLIVLTRGGGSLEDLASFSDERVARAIYSSKVPVVTGIGHEEDISIADLVADVRASTPSNAAELIVRNFNEISREINFNIKTIEHYLENMLKDQNFLILRSVSQLKNIITQKIALLHLAISNFGSQYKVFLKNISIIDSKITQLSTSLIKDTDYWIRSFNIEFKNTVRVLNTLHPKQVLKRGYSITINKNNQIIKSTKNLHKGELITSVLFDGKIDSEVQVIK